MTRAFEDSWLSDDPLKEIDDEELFGRTHLIERIIEVLSRVREHSNSSTIGLVGSWGSGKSTVLDGLVRRLRAPDEATVSTLGETWHVAEFNPWLYSGALELHLGFFQTLRDAFPDDERWSDKKSWLVNLGKTAAPLAGIAGIAGVDGASIARELLDRATDSVVKQRDKVARALAKAKQPVLVVVDDLDRLSAEELLQVFKLVRLVGRLPYVYYLLSYDEHTVVDLLSKTDLVAADDDRRALDYLEKIVQVRLDMPLLRYHEVDQIVQRAITFLTKKYRVPTSTQETQRLSEVFDEVLSHRLRTPRAIKRVFGQMDAFFGSVEQEVSFDDFLIITWLRTMEPGVYGLIQSHKKELLGNGGFTLRNVHLGETTSVSLRATWLTRLSRARVDDASADDLLYLLQVLFPRLEPIYRNEDVDRRHSAYPPGPVPGRVSHPDYFDRYFSFGVPTDDIADATVRAAVVGLAEGRRDTDAVNALAELMHVQPELAIRKIWQSADATGLASVAVVRWLETWWLSMERHSLASGRLEGLSASIVYRLRTEQSRQLASDIAGSVEGALFMACVTHAVDSAKNGLRDDADLRTQVTKALLDGLVPRYREHLADAGPTPLDADERVRSLLLYWRLHAPESLKAALQERMDEGWDVVDTIAWLLPLRDFGGDKQQLSEFGDHSYITAVFDMDFVIEKVSGRLGQSRSLNLLRDQPATDEIRREGALALVELAIEATKRPDQTESD